MHMRLIQIGNATKHQRKAGLPKLPFRGARGYLDLSRSILAAERRERKSAAYTPQQTHLGMECRITPRFIDETIAGMPISVRAVGVAAVAEHRRAHLVAPGNQLDFCR